VNLPDLSRGDAGDAEQRPADEHLHPCGEERRARERRRARVERARRPAERGDEDRGRADEIDTVRGRADEHDDPGEADAQPGHGPAAEAGAEHGPIEQRDPERDRRAEQRGHARVEPLLRPGDAAAPDEEESEAGRAGGEPLAPVGCSGGGRFAPPRPNVEHGAGDQEADGGHQQRRHRADRDHHREVRRPPDQVDRAQAGADGRSATAAKRTGCHGCYRLGEAGHQPRGFRSTRRSGASPRTEASPAATTTRMITMSAAMTSQCLCYPIRTNQVFVEYDY
jgi:hypothetical protein